MQYLYADSNSRLQLNSNFTHSLLSHNSALLSQMQEISVNHNSRIQINNSNIIILSLIHSFSPSAVRTEQADKDQKKLSENTVLTVLRHRANAAADAFKADTVHSFKNSVSSSANDSDITVNFSSSSYGSSSYHSDSDHTDSASAFRNSVFTHNFCSSLSLSVIAHQELSSLQQEMSSECEITVFRAADDVSDALKIWADTETVNRFRSDIILQQSSLNCRWERHFQLMLTTVNLLI